MVLCGDGSGVLFGMTNGQIGRLHLAASDETKTDLTKFKETFKGESEFLNWNFHFVIFNMV